MSALRKAGVWLGLIEDDDEVYYDDRSYDEEYPDDEFADAGAVVRNRVADRLAGQRAERNERHERSERVDRTGTYDDDQDDDRVSADASEGRLSSVRQISRPNSALESPSQRMRANESPVYPTQDNLALVPEHRAAETRPEVRTETRPEVKVAPRPVDERRYQITTLHPMTFNDARTIGENFRDGVPVILNLTEMGEADAKRLVDFAAGLAFGLRGTMERVTNRVFLLSPANIQVTAEDKAKIAEGGFFYQ